MQLPFIDDKAQNVVRDIFERQTERFRKSIAAFIAAHLGVSVVTYKKIGTDHHIAVILTWDGHEFARSSDTINVDTDTPEWMR